MSITIDLEQTAAYASEDAWNERKKAAARNLLYEKGYNIEMLVSFEPQYTYFTKWWSALYPF